MKNQALVLFDAHRSSEISLSSSVESDISVASSLITASFQVAGYAGSVLLLVLVLVQLVHWCSWCCWCCWCCIPRPAASTNLSQPSATSRKMAHMNTWRGTGRLAHALPRSRGPSAAALRAPQHLLLRKRHIGTAGIESQQLFSPTPEHVMLREMVRSFAEEQVDPQALEHDRLEAFNHALFKEAGALGLPGVTVPEEFGGTGLDATASVIVHEELAAADPGFCLAYL